MPICKEPQPEKHNPSKYNPTGDMVYLDKVLANPALPTYILKAAKELTYSVYMTTGEYFDKLDDVEVLELKLAVDGIITEDFITFKYLTPQSKLDMYHLTLLTMLLLRGEGVIEVHANEIREPLAGLFTLIRIEDLYRSGKLEVFRDNFTITDIYETRPIARSIPEKGNDEKPK